LFTVGYTAGTFEDSAIEAQSLPTGQRKTLVRGGYFARYVPSGHLLYVRQGTLYAAPMDLKRLELTGPSIPVVEGVAVNAITGFAQVDFSQTGTLVYMEAKGLKLTLTWLENTGQTRPFPAAPTEYNGPLRFSPDGKRLAVSIADGGKANIWVYEWERGNTNRLTFGDGFDTFPVWSPDGKHIVFSSTVEESKWNLFQIRADGAGEPVRLTDSKNNQFARSFSPDGKRLVFTETDPKTGGDIWTLPLDGVESDHPKVGKPEPFLVTPASEISPMISPDGHWLAYLTDESGRSEVYVRPFPGSSATKWQISTAGGTTPVWSKKGSELFYLSHEGIMVANYTTTREAFAHATPRLWASKKDSGDYFDIAPDGKRLVVEQPETSEAKGPVHATFLLNFFDELRRKAPTGK
jgi:serine/threonine-protein kinase